MDHRPNPYGYTEIETQIRALKVENIIISNLVKSFSEKYFCSRVKENEEIILILERRIS